MEKSDVHEFTGIYTIKLIVSVMAESESDAMDRAFGWRWEEDANMAVYNFPPTLLHSQVIDGAAYSPVSWGCDGFKARTFREAARELDPEREEDCEARPRVFPAGYPGLPQA